MCKVTAVGSSQEADLSPSGHGDEASRADSLRNSKEDFPGKISTDYLRYINFHVSKL